MDPELLVICQQTRNIPNCRKNVGPSLHIIGVGSKVNCKLIVLASSRLTVAVSSSTSILGIYVSHYRYRTVRDTSSSARQPRN